jgi:MFS family permease
MLPLHLFRNPVFVIANLVVFALGLSTFGAIQYLPTFVQTALGASATVSGIITTPQSLGLLFTSIIGGQIITRTGKYRWTSMLGTAVAAGAVAMLATMTVHEPRWRISLFMVVLGLGSGLVGPTMSIVVQNAVPYRLLGVATSSTQFFRQIGSVLGAAIFGALLASSYHASFQDNVPPAVRDQVPAATLAEFDDPTLGIDPHKSAIVREEVTALPGGEALFAEASQAQRDAVAHATRVIFATAAVIAALAFVATLFLKELPLRRDFREENEAGELELTPAVAAH